MHSEIDHQAAIASGIQRTAREVDNGIRGAPVIQSSYRLSLCSVVATSGRWYMSSSLTLRRAACRGFKYLAPAVTGPLSGLFPLFPGLRDRVQEADASEVHSGTASD